MYHNIVIGIPLVDPAELISTDETDWNETELQQTLFTDTRYLPAVLKEAGVVPSTSEIRRNRPDLMITVTDTDCFWIKWGKNKIFVIVGEPKETSSLIGKTVYDVCRWFDLEDITIEGMNRITEIAGFQNGKLMMYYDEHFLFHFGDGRYLTPEECYSHMTDEQKAKYKEWPR